MEVDTAYTTKMMPFVTKHPVDCNCFLSVKNMSEKGLEHDHITVNTTIYCEIPLQLDNQKFIFMPKTTIYCLSREKKNIQLNFNYINKISSMKTMILLLKDC